MSQQSARNTVFLDEMGVGPLWQLRHPAPAQPGEATAALTEAPAAPVVQDAAPAAPAPAPVATDVPAPVEAEPPALAPVAAAVAAREAEAVAVEGSPLAVPVAATMSDTTEDVVAIDIANASAADMGNEDSTAWFDDAPAPARPAPVSEQAIAAMDWPALKNAIASCTRCELCATRRATVQGRGHTGAQWMAITAAPNRLDEKEGRSVAGEAGQLLDNMLKAIGLTMESDVYLTGLVKCRPSGDDGAERPPTPDEVAACRPFLERELALTGAGMVLTFGQAAAKGLLGVASRGKVHRYGELPVVATYHPADLLRLPEDKAKAWADLCLARTTRDHAA
ncbi:uracil-DNA glycosylase [Rugamonas fusca]|uniref:uracil-DNA glycosylase n=1 Tax=Rugamonas fusca TaxID=2758568 RepID=UPI001E4F5D12|nr:uracil-DNA glycosylase [Rugamonas fusca]